MTSDPAYIVGAENDHIVPWKSAYASTRLLSGPVRYVLSSGGHIAGIVNPPGPKGWYVVGSDHRPRPTSGAAGHPPRWSWWRTGRYGPPVTRDSIDPPPTGSHKYNALYDGPGKYIRT